MNWSEEEIKLLKKLCMQGLKFKDIALYLNRTMSCVMTKSSRLGIKKKIIPFKHTEETKQKQRISKIGIKNPMWKVNVSYGAIHQWVKRNKSKPSFCVICKIAPPKDLANISGLYKRDINDYEWLCRKCHMTKDKRIFNFNKKRKNNTLRDGITGRFIG